MKNIYIAVILSLAIVLAGCKTQNNNGGAGNDPSEQVEQEASQEETSDDQAVADGPAVVDFGPLADEEIYVGPYEIEPNFGSYHFDGTADEDRPVPDIEGLVYRTNQNFHYGFRCPEDEAVLKFISQKTKDFVDWCLNEDLENKAVDFPLLKGALSSEAIDSHYLDALMSLTKIPDPEREGAIEQYARLFFDIWNTDKLCTVEEDGWYDYMSNGNNAHTSWYTIDKSSGNVLTLDDLVAEKDRPAFAKLAFKHLVGYSGHWLDYYENIYESDLENYLGQFTGFALIPEGVIAYAHPYYMGSGAEGQYNAVIPYDEVKGLLKSNIRKLL